MSLSSGEKSSETKSLQETIVISPDTIETPSYPVPHQQSFALAHSATDLEKTYYLKSIKGESSISRYRFQEKIVSGGMGSILKVLDQNFQRSAAMKVILPELKNKEDFLRSFITEARITGLLEHPNIMPVHDIGLLPETGLFFTMKLARGESLIDVIDQIKEGNPEYIHKYNIYHLLSIFRKVCDAISYAHAANIIHQDIKPHNIMVGQYGEVLLMDWGLAKYVGDPEEETELITREFLKEIIEFSKTSETTIKGSPPYMAPEQVKTPHLIDKRTDIFLLGATLYHILTYEQPYQGKTVYEVLYNAESRNLISPEKRNPNADTPQEICRIIIKAMAPRRDDRYQSVEELIRDIDDLMAGRWKHQDKKHFAKGQLLMTEGQKGEEAYLILKGSAEVFKEKDGHKIVLGALKEGDIVGEMALISQEKRTASVMALENTEVAVLTRHLLSHNLKKIPPYIEKIVSTITSRLQIANERITKESMTFKESPFSAPPISSAENSDFTYPVLKKLLHIFKTVLKNRETRVSIGKIEEQISIELKIPIQHVKDILSKAVNLKLLNRRSNNILIPDLTELAHFIDLANTFTHQP